MNRWFQSNIYFLIITEYSVGLNNWLLQWLLFDTKCILMAIDWISKNFIFITQKWRYSVDCHWINVLTHNKNNEMKINECLVPKYLNSLSSWTSAFIALIVIVSNEWFQTYESRLNIEKYDIIYLRIPIFRWLLFR